MTDDAAVFLLGAGQESRNILKRNEGNIEGVAEAHEARPLHRGVDIEASGEERGLIGHDAYALPAQSRETHHQVFGKVLVDLHKVTVIHDSRKNLFDDNGSAGSSE